MTMNWNCWGADAIGALRIALVHQYGGIKQQSNYIVNKVRNRTQPGGNYSFRATLEAEE